VLIVYQEGTSSGGDQLRYFHRFPATHEGDYWYQGRNKWDGVCFIPKKTIKVYGFTSFEFYNDNERFVYGVKYKIDDPRGNEVVDTQEWEAEDDGTIAKDKMFTLMFTDREPILVKAGYKLHIAQWIRAASISDHMWYGE
jgi:hypothetical protein